MNTTIRISLLIALLLLPVRCSVDLKVVFFNNTSSPVQLEVAGKQFPIEPGDSRTFQLSKLYSGAVSVLKGQVAYRYAIAHETRIPSQYYRSGGWAARIWVQLQPDLSIHLVPIGEPSPVVTPGPQPSGFPILPS